MCLSIFAIPMDAGLSDLINQGTDIPYCHGDDADKCGLENGFEHIKQVDDLENDRSASEYIQDVVAYVLSFLAIITVLIIIYAWFIILTSVGDDDKVSGAKKTIIYAFAGLVLIFLAFPIAEFMIDILTGTPDA